MYCLKIFLNTLYFPVNGKRFILQIACTLYVCNISVNSTVYRPEAIQYNSNTSGNEKNRMHIIYIYYHPSQRAHYYRVIHIVVVVVAVAVYGWLVGG